MFFKIKNEVKRFTMKELIRKIKTAIAPCPSVIQIDQVIPTPIFTSYFSYLARNPLFVAYNLHKGGGDGSRKGMAFETGGQIYSATAKDYSKSEYDEGHMADAEDFACDSVEEKETFHYFNCMPQTAKLNRGCWKVLETEVRKISQDDHLFILCGGGGWVKKIGNISVPNFCWKIIKNLDKNTVNCYYFPNDNSDTRNDITFQALLLLIPECANKLNILL